MGFISKAYYFFAPYTDAHEKAVATFFKGLNEHSGQTHTRARLGNLIQRDIAVINLWTEYRYKGYHYLRKAKRRRLYANLQLIAADFDRFYRQHAQPADTVLAHVRAIAPESTVDPAKATLLHALMGYFSPGQGLYEYRDSSSFGRLLRDPAHETLVGDCNQIVTLYIYLYSRYYDVRDLQVRTLPGHVALHYSGVDIEATNSTYANYETTSDNALLPIEEIVSINLLDTTDSYLSTHEIAAEVFLQASRFAFVLSHDRQIVTQNLAAAYNNLVVSLLQRNNYKRALDFAGASGNKSLLSTVGHNGALYEMDHHNYAAARRFAAVADDRDILIRSSWRAEGAHHYQAKRYHEAIRAFDHTDDREHVQQCYEALFFEEQAKLGTNLTTESIKQYRKTINRMRLYAKKSGNKGLIEHTNALSQHL